MIHCIPATLMLLALAFAPAARQEPTSGPKPNTWTVQAAVLGNQSVPTKLNVVLHIQPVASSSEAPILPVSVREGAALPRWDSALSQSLPTRDAYLCVLIMRVNKPEAGKSIVGGMRLIPGSVPGDLSLRILLPKGWSVPKTESIHIRGEGMTLDSPPSLHTIPHGSSAYPTLLAVKLPSVMTTGSRQRAPYVVEFTLLKAR
jgi:hypothetical protein